MVAAFPYNGKVILSYVSIHTLDPLHPGKRKQMRENPVAPDGKACVPPCVVSGLAPGPAMPYTVTPTTAATTAFLRTRDFLFSKFLTYNVICQLSLRWGWGMDVSKRPGVLI